MTLPLASIIDIMNGIHRMPKGFRLELFQTAQRREVRAKEILLKPDEICDHIFYIEKGILGCFRKDGKKSNYLWLMFAGDFATSVDSFNERVPSKETIVAVEDCIVWTITHQNNEDFTKKCRAYGVVRQKLTDKYHIQAREIDAQRHRSREQFYDFLVKTYPDIIRVPNKILASFMGITEPTLYKLLKNRRRTK
jgi:CRP-like cAMP-binding protein